MNQKDKIVMIMWWLCDPSNLVLIFWLSSFKNSRHRKNWWYQISRGKMIVYLSLFTLHFSSLNFDKLPSCVPFPSLDISDCTITFQLFFWEIQKDTNPSGGDCNHLVIRKILWILKILQEVYRLPIRKSWIDSKLALLITSLSNQDPAEHEREDIKRRFQLWNSMRSKPSHSTDWNPNRRRSRYTGINKISITYVT